MHRGFRSVLIGGVFVAVAGPLCVYGQGQVGVTPRRGAPGQPAAPRAVTFSKDVLPILENNCNGCHGDAAKGGLRLDTRENLLLGGLRGEVIVKGDPDKSRLIKLVESPVPPRMPPQGARLSNKEIAVLKQWIKDGAQPDPEIASTSDSKLTIQEPKTGANVREKVRVVIPRDGIPPEGFVGVYIDGQFKVALAPPSEEELEADKKPLDSPLVYVWDTKAPIITDSSASQQQRFAQDGPHTIEIRSYAKGGGLSDKVSTQVNVTNAITAAPNTPVKLWYDGRPVGRQYELDHTVDLEANAVQGRGTAAGPDRLVQQENGKYLVSLEDMVLANGTGFWRERRLSPLTLVVDNLKHVIRAEGSSRYYSLTRTGKSVKSRQMERENREPILNPIELPGRSQRMNEPFTGNVNVMLGAYIPGTLRIPRVQSTIEGLEWQNGEKCVKVHATYNAGKGKVDIVSWGMQGVDFDVAQGETTVWFSQSTGRVIKAKHDVVGNIVVDVSKLGNTGGMMGSPAGEFNPGSGFGSGNAPGGGGNGPGAFMAPRSPYGGFGGPGGGNRPGGGGGGGNGPGGGFGGVFGGPAGGNGPGGSSAFGSPFGGSPYGAFNANQEAPNTGLPGPTTKRYHVNLKVTTQVVAPGK